MKRILPALLALVLAVSLAACATTDEDTVREPVEVSVGSTQKESRETQPKETEPEKMPEAAITETVLMEEAGVKITAKSLNTDEWLGPELKLLIENNSGQDLTFQCRKASINGYMVETMMSVDVVDGKKANDTLTFLASELKACGIETIADMEFSFHIFTTADWETYLDTPQIRMETSAAEGYVYSYDDSGDVVYEENGIKIVVKGLVEEDSLMGPGILVYMENNTDADVTVQVRDVSINGFMVDALFSSDLVAEKHAVDTITFLSSQLEENEITGIEEVELSFHIFDFADWETIDDSDTITLAF